MWVLPTHKRPEKLRRFLQAVTPQDAEEHVLLLAWRDDPRLPDYAPVFNDLPRAWDVWLCSERLCGEKLNLVFQQFPNEGYYGLLTDDVQLGTPGMLRELRQEALNGMFTWPDDGIHGPRGATHPCAPGKLIRALGFWAHPRFPHNGLDTVLYAVSEEVGLSKYRPDLKLVVRHPLTGQWPEEWDDTYREAQALNSKAVDDMYEFRANEFPGLVKQVRRAYAQG